MASRNNLIRATLALGLLLPAGCGLVAITDGTLEPQEPLPAAAVVIAPVANGSGILVDRGERLLITSSGLLRPDDPGGVEVVFPVQENGKVKVKRDYYLLHAQRIKATVLANNTRGDLAALRLQGEIPEDAVEVKLAADGCQAGQHVRLIGAVDRLSQLWHATETTVQSVGEQKLTFANDQKVATRMAQLEFAPSLGKTTRGGPVVNDSGEVVALISGGGGEPPHLMAVDGRELRSFLSIVYCRLARTAIQKGDCKKAIALCDMALTINPNYALAHNERGAALSYLDRYDDAIAAYSQALKLDPRMAFAYRNRGSAYFHKGEYQQAVDDCTHAIKLAPKYTLAYKTRSQAYAKLNRTVEARADEEQVRELNKINWKAASPFPDSWFWLPLYPPS